MNYDLIVLGTGGAGYRVAVQASKAGWKVAAINDGLFGGTCAVRGCVPKKVLAGTAEILDFSYRLHGFGIIAGEPELSWPALMRHKRSFTDPVPEATKEGLKAAGIDVYEGSPRFTGNIEITVNDHVLKAKKAHIAVGARPARLAFVGFEHLVTSDQFLELEQLPKRILFVGGGYVSFELAHIAARFRSQVTIVHKDERPLAWFDEEIVAALCEASKEVGVEIVLGARVAKVERRGEEYVVSTEDGRSIAADLVVHGAGRPPAIADLNLEAVGIEYDLHKGIKVNAYLQTTHPDIYAAGDAAAGSPHLSPVANVHGRIVAQNLLGQSIKQPSYLSTPSVVFTTPPMARVGLLEKETQKDVDVVKTDLTPWLDNKRIGVKHAMSKVIVEKGTQRILGAHIIGHHAEEVINLFGLAIELGLTTEQLKRPILAFPTAMDDMRSMF